MLGLRGSHFGTGEGSDEIKLRLIVGGDGSNEGGGTLPYSCASIGNGGGSGGMESMLTSLLPHCDSDRDGNEESSSLGFLLQRSSSF